MRDSAPSSPATLGLVIAGGLARRMGGGDKAAIVIGGVAILDRVLAMLRPACTDVILNANGDPARFARHGLAVVPDSVPDFAGPLAGVLAGLEWAAANRGELDWVASAPGDCPFLPRDLVARLHEVRRQAGTKLACARSLERRHPLAALWPVALRHDLRHALVAEGEHRVGAWMARHGTAVADWPAQPVDPFFNVNSPEDAAAAERLAPLARVSPGRGGTWPGGSWPGGSWPGGSWK